MAAPAICEFWLRNWRAAFASPEWPEIFAAWLAAEAELERRHALNLAKKLHG